MLYYKQGRENSLINALKTMRSIREKIKPTLNKVLSFLLFIGVAFSVITIVSAVAPNPGHNFTEVSGSVAQGDILYGSAADTLSALAKNITATRYLSNTGASNNPAWVQIDLTNGVTGALPVGNGGTGATTLTANNVILGNGTAAPLFVAPGTSGNTLTSNGTTWTSVAPAVRSVYNQSVAQQGAGFASDTYLTNSNTLIPATGLRVGTRYHMIMNVNKTAAGTATPIVNVRFGTAGTTADTARCTLTHTAQTSATDSGTFEVWVTFRTIGSGTSAVIQCVSQRRHGASVTGFGNLVSEALTATSAGFDSTVANSIIGVSINGGTSASWTVQLVQAELTNLP